MTEEVSSKAFYESVSNWNMEQPLFIENNEYKLFALLHEAGEPIGTNQISDPDLKKPCFVFCHPFAEEKLISHRVMVNLARRLAREGVSCLRFDYMGHGDSDGRFEDSTVETRLSDIICAVHFLKNRAQNQDVGLIGVRFGATLAALAAEKLSGVDPLIIISPVINGKAYMEQCLRSNLAAQNALYRKVIKDREALVRELMAGDTVNIEWYLLTKALYEQMV